jgi:hypothetical protein
MSSNKELSIRERVGNFYLNNKHMKKSLIVNHFKFEGIPKSTIYSIIKRVDIGISLDRKSGSGQSERIDQKISILQMCHKCAQLKIFGVFLRGKFI